DAAERLDLTGGTPPLPRLVDLLGDGDPARVRMLPDHRHRLVDLSRDPPGALEIREVVVRELLAPELLDARQEVPPPARLDVERRRLMMVLAVRQIGDLPKRQRQLGRAPLVAPGPLRHLPPVADTCHV